MSDDDELPDLATLLAPSISSTVARRQSPRKGKPARQIADDRFSYEASASVQQMRGSPRKPAQKKTSPIKVESRKPSSISLGYVPVLSRNSSTAEVAASSSNSLARSPQQRSIGLTHVDSLLLPLSKVCLDGISRQPSLTRGLAGPKSEATRMSRSLKAFKSSKHLNVSTKASQFVLYEAACADVSDDSRVDDEGDEDTDLSGFVVDDDADLSVHDSSSDSEYDKKAKRKPSASPRRRRIQQGSRPNEPVEVISLDSDSDKENKHEQILSSAFQDMSLGLHGHQSRKQDAEVVDLTSSPVRTQRPLDRQDGNTEGLFDQYTAPREPGQPVNLFEDFDAILRLSPPRSSDPSILQTKVKSKPTDLSDVDVEDRSTDNMPVKGNFRTPPTTPPRSPSKLKSPSKLLSPSKRAAQIPNSPHRQSIDGFWDLEVVNTWHDTYSPKKEPLASPKKNRFQQWLDSDDEDDGALSALVNDSSDSPPSPCSSPKKPRSPLKSPEKAEKQRFLEEKRAAKAKKQEFNSKKEQIATTLLHDLDTNIASSKLTTLSSSTGGVQIIWSKTLRSTAGRANWRRTLIKPSGSPVKGPAVPSDSKVQHYASIELAAKVIDCESRLVNTLAHEFCHLANFMVSGVRDQPHGASFKAWAAKVTTYLRSHDNLMYRGVEVTTKHNYAIEFKYLWVCTGREMLEMLKSVPEMENGCGAEYGRHSKSIDTEKSRCGRCKGVLVQVRPKPRKVDPERRSPRKALFQKKSNVETMTGAVEFVDLSD